MWSLRFSVIFSSSKSFFSDFADDGIHQVLESVPFILYCFSFSFNQFPVILKLQLNFRFESKWGFSSGKGGSGREKKFLPDWIKPVVHCFAQQIRAFFWESFYSSEKKILNLLWPSVIYLWKKWWNSWYISPIYLCFLLCRSASSHNRLRDSV